MTSTQVNCFLTVANLKSYTQASKILYLSQPTISRYVANLEKELGCSLLKRSTKHIELTPEGELYHHMFTQWKLDQDIMAEKIYYLQNSPTQTITLGYMEEWEQPEHLDTYIRHFHDLYSQVHVEVICLGINEIMDRLRQKTLDIGIIITNPLIQKYQLQKCPITRLQKLILYSSKNNLAHQKSLSAQDFKNETFLTIKSESQHALNQLTEYCKSIGIYPNIKEVENVSTILAYIRNNQGVAIFDEWVQGKNDPDFSAFPIPLYGDIDMVWNEELGIKYSRFFSPDYFIS